MGNGHSFMIGANDDASTGAENHLIGSVKEIYVRAGATCPTMSAAQARHLFGGGIPPENAYPGSSPELYCRLGTNDTYAEVTNRSEAGTADGTITGGSSADIVDDSIDKIVPRHSLAFDGSNDCVTMGNVLDKAHDDSFTAMAWCKTSSSAVQRIISKRTTAVGTAGWDLTYDGTNNRLEVALVNNGGGGNYIYIRYSVDIDSGGDWHHVAMTYDGSSGTTASNVKVYLDGVELTPSVVTDALSASISNSAPLLISGYGSAAAPSNPWNGSITFAAIFGDALTDTEIKEAVFHPDLREHSRESDLEGFWLCGNDDDYSTITDYGSGGNDGTMTNMSANDIVDESPKIPAVEYSTSFDGTNDCITLGDNFDRALSDPWSLSYWLKTSSASAHAPVSKMASGGAGYSVYHQPSSTKITVNLTNTATSDEIVRDFGSLSDLDDGEWHHYVVTYDGGGDTTDVKLYIDGVEKSGSGVTNNLSGSLTNAAPFLIGGRYSSSSPSDPVNGNMCGVSIWDDDLSSTEVSEIFKTGLPRDLRIHSARAADLESNYHVGQDDTYPTADDIEGSTDGTYTNMAGSSNIEQYDAPVGFGAL